MKKQLQKGFTLIELMIVVAIIGILASIALPAYQQYTKRAHVIESLVLTSEAKTAVSEYYATTSEFPRSNELAGLASPTDINGTAVDSLTIGSGGTITALFNSKVEDQKTLILVPSNATGSITWTCNTGTVNHKYVPSRCR